ncbi:MAG: heavy metal translocating P-type ATPase [Planctomycetota bacterium]
MEAPADFFDPQRPARAVRDPVCGMTVDPATDPARAEHDGRVYLFCCGKCRVRFLADPARHLAAPGQAGMVAPAHAPAPPPPGTRFTCPMHPQIEQDGPGPCPLCGMALEPMTPSIDEGPSDEERDMVRRFLGAAVLTLPVVVSMLTGVPAHGAVLLQGLCTAPVVLWAAQPFFARAVESLRARSPNMFTLIALGVGAAFAWSVGVTALGLAAPVHFEAAASIVTLTLLGQVLELRARRRTGDAIRALMRLAPDTAVRVDADGVEREVALAEIVVGDRLRIRAGQRVPVDGRVLEGRSAVDESMLTGEPIPVAKAPDDDVTGGTLNGEGSILVRAQRVGADATLARIVALVAQAQRSRAPIQGLADRVAAWFVPAVVAVAAVALIAWLLLGSSMGAALAAAIAVLVVACPCALGLATPMSVTVGIGLGARHGVLVRDAAALQTLAEVDVLLVDKTGTLTQGRPVLRGSWFTPAVDEVEILADVAALERASAHPLAGAIVAAAESRGAPAVTPADFTSIPGQGVHGRCRGHDYLIGSPQFVRGRGVDTGGFEARIAEQQDSGSTLVLVARDGEATLLLALADELRGSSAEAITALRRDGLRVVMVTGDTRAGARPVARALGLDDVETEVTPQRKAEVVTRWQQQGHRVAMAGDGVNDAVALARADVGIAMGQGSDVAIDVASITLVRSDLRAIVRARVLARATLRNIRQNLVFAFAYNLIGVPLAAGLLQPLTGAVMSPMVAAAAMSLSSVSVIANALRLRRVPLDAADSA